MKKQISFYSALRRSFPDVDIAFFLIQFEIDKRYLPNSFVTAFSSSLLIILKSAADWLTLSHVFSFWRVIE